VDQVPHVEGGGDRFQLVQRGGGAVRVEHLQLGGRRRVPDGDAGGEPVPLRLREGIGALHLDRVLRGDHHERGLQPVGGPVDGDLTLLHAFQQRGLGLRRGPVDLVADDEVREDRSRLELEVAAFLVIGVDSGDIAGQQVGGELHPPHRAVDGFRQRLRQHRLPHARHVLDEQVPLGDQDGEREPNGVRLAVNDRLDRRADPLGHRDEIIQLPLATAPRIHNQQALLVGRGELPLRHYAI
jgi:hypothetical protein